MASMSLQTLFKWQRYFSQKNARLGASAEGPEWREKSPEEMIDILNRYQGRPLNA